MHHNLFARHLHVTTRTHPLVYHFFRITLFYCQPAVRVVQHPPPSMFLFSSLEPADSSNL